MKIAVAGALMAGAALAAAGSAAADNEPAPPGPPPAEQPAPGPIMPQQVPEIPNAAYGADRNGVGFFGTIRDLWHQAQDPYGMTNPEQAQVVGAAPPAGAGPAPQLPPGYLSTNAPGSEAPAKAPDETVTGPALPEGYYSLDGPPPPDYEFVPGGVPVQPPAETPAQ
ncbi:hypothetical protein MBRU_00815 [Mycolicibacterium brumae DSM 44177]|nr:hypothetical protein MBRU_00815 [Mycolicibacterium brumae DSM 44177]